LKSLQEAKENKQLTKTPGLKQRLRDVINSNHSLTCKPSPKKVHFLDDFQFKSKFVLKPIVIDLDKVELKKRPRDKREVEEPKVEKKVRTTEPSIEEIMFAAPPKKSKEKSVSKSRLT